MKLRKLLNYHIKIFLFRRLSIYNVGKNRIIYDIEEVHVDRTKEDYLAKLKDKLNKAEYTVLSVFQDNERKTTLYTIGKVKKYK